MALLVTDNGEIDSLRNLLNYNQEIPRNLILKLFTTNTYPNESDTPSQSNYYEPYTNNNSLGYGFAPVTGYPQIVNNRTDQNYANQYGILLNGNKWTIETLQNAAVTVQGSGVAAEYTITVAANTGIKKGDYVTGGSVGTGAYVVDIDGLTLLLSVKNVGTFTNQNLDFGQGRTTASYPEETFTFSGAAGDVYGYMLVRANNMPTTIHGVEDAASVSTATTISKTGVRGTIGNNYIRLAVYHKHYNRHWFFWRIPDYCWFYCRSSSLSACNWHWHCCWRKNCWYRRYNCLSNQGKYWRCFRKRNIPGRSRSRPNCWNESISNCYCWCYWRCS